MLHVPMLINQEMFENIKTVIRSRKSKDLFPIRYRKYNVQKEK